MSAMLFWSKRGDVACTEHAPPRDSTRWIPEGWRPLDAVTTRRVFRCAQCAGTLFEPRPRSPRPVAGVSYLWTLRKGTTRVVTASLTRLPSPELRWRLQIRYEPDEVLEIRESGEASSLTSRAETMRAKLIALGWQQTATVGALALPKAGTDA
jgi:hypothetical protein